MRTLYLDCGMGAAGDMLSAALLELCPRPDEAVAELNALGIPGVAFAREKAVKCGVTGTHLAVTVQGQEEESHDVPFHRHEQHSSEQGQDAPLAAGGAAGEGEGHSHGHGAAHHAHSGMGEITALVRSLPLSPAVCQKVLEVYALIAGAESCVHGVPVEQVHFHEVGALDAVADITAFCLLMEKLSPDQVLASPVRVGSGQVRCAHGILPVPAPAAALLLKGVPIYSGEIEGELCTPTGAALLKRFVTCFGEMPVLQVERIGYGCGKKDFAAANCVRALLGESAGETDTVSELSCNLDDMTPEEIGFALERCFEAGALEAYTVPIGMKKSRPGVLLCVLCPREKTDEMIRQLFCHTSTLGVREQISRRYTLRRKVAEEPTSLGVVRRKWAEGYGVIRSKYEYEDLARLAREKGLSLREVKARLEGKA